MLKMKKKKKKRLLIGTSVFIILAVCFTGFIISNTSSLREGKIYYYLGNLSPTSAYEFNVRTRISKKIKLEGYDTVLYYIPLKDGYIAAARNENSGDSSTSIIYNGKTISKEPLDNLSVKDNYIVYINSEYALVAVNVKSNERFVLLEDIRYGYAFVDDYLYFSGRDPESPNKETDIYVVDCSKETLKKTVVDKGIIFRNTKNALVYSKEGDLYEYNFEKMQAKKTVDYNFESDSYNRRYLGYLKTKDKYYSIHFNQLVIYPKSANGDYESYEQYLLKGGPVFDFDEFCLFSRFKISDEKGSLFIPVKNAKRVNIVAYENDGEIYFSEQPCTYWIY